MKDHLDNAALPPAVDDWLRARRLDPHYKRRAIDLLGRMIQVDSTPKPAPAASARCEDQVFEIVEQHMAAYAPEARIERVPVTSAIVDHPYFTVPYYASEVTARGGDRSLKDLITEVYQGRANLFVRLPRPGAKVLAFNAHVDTVLPHVPLRIEGDTVYGRGAVDDKGPCVAMMLAVELLAGISRQFGIRPACELLLEFVIDEETGGNGSLSVALTKDKSSFNAIIVLECTGLQISPGNRGVVWYQAGLDLKPAAPVLAGRDALLEAAAFVIGSFGRCGDAIKAESDHPLFPHRPAQTCHGIIGTYGQHPSRVNDYIPLCLTWRGPLEAEIRKLVDEAVVEYCRRYGDKTQPGAGEAAIERHTTWASIKKGISPIKDTPSPSERPADNWTYPLFQDGDSAALLEVFGIAGHMGSVDRLDGAITKAATIIRRLVEERERRGGDWASVSVTLQERPDLHRLVLEGGQGFLPTHRLDEISARVQAAAREGVDQYVQLVGLPPDAIRCDTRFDKLHNDSFARPVDGPAMTSILAAASAAGTYHGEPIRGWDVSCDARIFAREFPDSEVITFGPGALSQAHSNDEHGDINDVLAVAETLARMALIYGR